MVRRDPNIAHRGRFLNIRVRIYMHGLCVQLCMCDCNPRSLEAPTFLRSALHRNDHDTAINHTSESHTCTPSNTRARSNGRV
jgi:hypothetical protein